MIALRVLSGFAAYLFLACLIGRRLRTARSHCPSVKAQDRDLIVELPGRTALPTPLPQRTSSAGILASTMTPALR